MRTSAVSRWSILGVFGGYCYINIDLVRVFAVRTPGLTVEQMDSQIFGEADAPAYQPKKGHKSLLAPLRVARTLLKTLNDEGAARARGGQGDRPRLPRRTTGSRIGDRRATRAGDDRLPAAVPSPFPTAHLHLVPGDGPDRCPRPDRREGRGGRPSDQAARRDRQRRVGRAVACALGTRDGWSRPTPILDGDLRRRPRTGCSTDWRPSRPPPSSAGGSTGSAPTTDIVDRTSGRRRRRPGGPMRRSCSPRSMRCAERIPRTTPGVNSPDWPPRRAAARDSSVAAWVVPRRWQFDKALTSGAVFSQGRERSKTTIIRAIHGIRLVQRALAARARDRGGPPDLEDFWLLSVDEVEAYMRDPAAHVGMLAERRALKERLAGLEPPFIVQGRQPPIDTWRSRSVRG